MRGDDLRARLTTGEPVLMPGVWDALSARLAVRGRVRHGRSCRATACRAPCSAFPTSATSPRSRWPKSPRRVCSAAPETMVVVDADTGYGNPLNVVRTVELWEAAGATGMFLEDQVWPKRCGHMAGKQVVPTRRLAGQAARRGRSPHPPARHRPHRCPRRRRARRGDRAGRMAAADVGVDAVFVEAPGVDRGARGDRRGAA